jgi:hypothetical protein
MAMVMVACGGAPSEDGAGAVKDDGTVSKTAETLETGTWSSAVLGNNTDQQTIEGDSWAKIAMMCEMLQNEGTFYEFFTDPPGPFVWAEPTNPSPYYYRYLTNFDSRDNAYTFFSLSRGLPSPDGVHWQLYGYTIVPNNQQTLSRTGGSACISRVRDPRNCVQTCRDGFSGYSLTGPVFP